MDQDKTLWSQVDQYFADHLLGSDEALEAALQRNEAEGLPAIDVAPLLGRFLTLLATIHGPSRILEIGTLGGYSTICLARSLPENGKLVSLELEAHHAEVARHNLIHAGVSSQVEIRVGPAADSLDTLIKERGKPFDLVFIDADKVSTPVYFEKCHALIRPGSVLLIDNTVRGGRIVTENSGDESIAGMRSFVAALEENADYTATALQTVGVKGYDGFVLVRRTL